MQSTALIIRPNHMPNIRVLEADGPFSIPDINHFPGTFLPVMSYEEWLAQPDHLKAPVTTPGDIKFDSACRIARLLDNAEYQQHLSARHLREIRWRLEELHPCCTGDILRSVSNSVPA